MWFAGKYCNGLYYYSCGKEIKVTIKKIYIMTRQCMYNNYTPCSSLVINYSNFSFWRKKRKTTLFCFLIVQVSLTVLALLTTFCQWKTWSIIPNLKVFNLKVKAKLYEYILYMNIIHW